MQKIDLGQKAHAEVTVGSKTYNLDLPTVIQAEQFQDKIKGTDGENLKVFREFIADLGIPMDVIKGLDIHQFRKLSDGLLGLAEKK